MLAVAAALSAYLSWTAHRVRRVHLRAESAGRALDAHLLRRAAADYGIDLERSFVVGDRAHDIAAGAAVGARGVLVRTGYGDRVASTDHGAGAVADNLMGAVSWILRQS